MSTSAAGRCRSKGATSDAVLGTKTLTALFSRQSYNRNDEGPRLRASSARGHPPRRLLGPICDAQILARTPLRRWISRMLLDPHETNNCREIRGDRTTLKLVQKVLTGKGEKGERTGRCLFDSPRSSRPRFSHRPSSPAVRSASSSG